jgi:hypothetical protein
MRHNAEMPVFEIPSDADPLAWPREVWAEFVQEHLDRFEKIVGAPMHELLGCGLFGCVYRSDGPWVVKITRDKAEGPAWATIADAMRMEENRKMTHGFLRVKEVVRIHPNVVFRTDARREYPVFAIVREEAQPVMVEDKDFGVAEPALSEETLKRIGLTEASLARQGLRAPIFNHVARAIGNFTLPVQKKFAQLYIALMETRRYRSIARDIMSPIPSQPDMVLILEMEQRAKNIQKTALSRELGATLRFALYNKMLFPDLHIYNLGWRSKATIAGDKRPRCMTILDPGLATTPYMTHIREAQLMANVGMYLRNAGLIDFEPND